MKKKKKKLKEKKNTRRKCLLDIRTRCTVFVVVYTRYAVFTRGNNTVGTRGIDVRVRVLRELYGSDRRRGDFNGSGSGSKKKKMALVCIIS